MGLETVTKVSDLNALWPLGSDSRSEGDDHIRNIKTAVLSLLSDKSQVDSRHADNETPTGGTAGSTSLTLANSPNPTASLILVRNGVVQQQGVGKDYTLSGATITLTTAVASDAAEWFKAWYRY